MGKIIKVGVLGLGRAGHMMHFHEFDKFPEQYQVIAGCDQDPERRAALHEKYPNVKLYSDAQSLFDDSEIDMITVATRTPDHVSHCIAALDAGKIVVDEKPIACSMEQASQLKIAAEKHPHKLYIRHNRRFEPAFAHIREIIASGKLGNVYEIKLRRHSYQWRNDWQTIIAAGGGQLLNWGPHLLDHGLRFLESPVESVWSDLKLTAALGDAEDHFKIILRGKNGRIIDIEVSGGVAIPENVYCIHGSLGTLVCKDEKTIRMRCFKAEERPLEHSTVANPPLEGGFGGARAPQWVEEEIPVSPASGDYTEKMWLYIYDDIMGKSPYPVKLEEALEVVRITDLIKKQSNIQDVR